MQNWLFLETFPYGAILDTRDITVRVQLHDPNVGFMEAHKHITAPRVHAGRPADLGHAPRVRVSAFFMQLES
jgi:hypothetical protein